MMDESLPTVIIPTPEHYCNLVVFPAPSSILHAPKFFLMKNKADVPKHKIGSVRVKYVPGSIYCLLPSTEKNHGEISMYRSKPGFLDSFTYCLEIKEDCVDFVNCKPYQPPSSSSAEKCSKCFISHFPSPNTLHCRLNKRRNNVRSTLLPRLRGGANFDTENLIIKRAIENAKAHGINVHAGVRNLGNGNCLFESVIDSINTRTVFQESIEETPDTCRSIWMQEVEDIAYDEWNSGLTKKEWADGWLALKNSRVYECRLGDLILPGIAHCVKKDIMVFNTSPRAHSPIYVIASSALAYQDSTTEVPICLAYDQVHYEPLVPDTEEDVEKTIKLKQAWFQGSYKQQMYDIPFLQSSFKDASTSYASVVKRIGERESKDNEKKSESEKGAKIFTRGSLNCFKKPKCVPKEKKDFQLHKQRMFQSSEARNIGKSLQPEKENTLEKNGYSSMSDSDSEELAVLKKIKKKDKTVEQLSRYDVLMKLQRKENVRLNMAKYRANQTPEKKNAEKEKHRKNMANKRKSQTPDEKCTEKEKHRKNMANKRKSQTPDEKCTEKEKHRKNMANKRKSQTPDEKCTEKEKHRKNMANKRKSQTPDEKCTEKEKHRKNMANKRKSQTPDEKFAEKEINKERMAAKRKDDSLEEKKLENEENRKRMTDTRAAQRTSVKYKEGLQSKEILQGSYKVPDLGDTKDCIGDMNVTCESCGALKFKKETASTCCNNGKVILEQFPEPPQSINELWHAATPEGRIFRENARSINNAVCLTSIKVKTRDFGKGYNPSIIFEGKATQLAGPLQAEDGDRPYFAQLYLHDPLLESGERFKNMTIPANMSAAQKKILEKILFKIQTALHEHNPFVKDFKQVIEIPAKDLKEGKIVISAKARPKGQHTRRYNEQINLQEVSILKNNEPHDLVLQVS